MPREKVKAFVYPAEAATTAEATNFAGFPGRWVPDQPIPVVALGLTLDEARAQIRALGLPLKEVTMEAPDEGELLGDKAPSSPAGMASEADREEGR